jgi:predicted kinase
MLIAMAGLPGTGKSSIARQLEKRLGALVFCKDDIRAALFAPRAVDYSREQDDLCMEVIFVLAGYVFRANPERTVIIDGRTFSQKYQLEQLLSRAGSLQVKPVIIECVCDDALAEQRLESDHRTGAHPAGNRTYALYATMKKTADPISPAHLVVNTGTEPLEKSVDRCVAYLKIFLH